VALSARQRSHIYKIKKHWRFPWLLE